jgi:penicillin amidase
VQPRRKILLVSLLVVLVATTGGALSLLLSSLPRRDGAATVAEMSATVHVELDVHAVPRLRGVTIEDVLSAEGFMHAQERYFQMDLLRRSAAGELAALFGARALSVDRARRPYEFRRRAAALRAALPPRHRGWLEAYVQGVNAGLHDLGAAPPEYLVFRAHPEPWTVEDSLLVVYAIYTMLSNNEAYEIPQAVMEAALPADVYEFLTPSTARLDRPLLFPDGDRTGGYAPARIPPAESMSLRERRPPYPPGRIVAPAFSGAASNQWASGAERSARRDAVLANDPHLELRVPNIFYRAELYWPGHAVRGVSIPGLPGVLLGASETLAWGATVSYADQSDWIVIEVDERDARRYRTENGMAEFGTATYAIAVAGQTDAEPLEVRTTKWGPVLDTDGLGRPLVLEATWLEQDGINLDLLDFMLADSVAEGLDVVERFAGPALNWMLADSTGAIGWGVNGPVPRRIGFDGSVPRPRSGGTLRWDGTVTMPRRGPETGVLFTANNRTLPRQEAASLGRIWMPPLRAQRIEELLAARERFTEQAFQTMQLDTRTRGYEPIRALVLEIVPAGETDARLRFARATAQDWNGRADAGEIGFLLMQTYYRVLLERVLAPLLASAFERDRGFVYRWPLAGEPLARLLEERPLHLLSAEYADWPELLRAALAEALERLAVDEAGAFATWGEANRLDVAHPLAGIPLLGRRLRWPAHAQSGSTVSVRVATPNYGAALRMAVSPAKPEAGFLDLPGGQSGHWLSRNFADLHTGWANGTPTPFLAGPTISAFDLLPAKRD